jgi:serine/threonine protein kinase
MILIHILLLQNGVYYIPLWLSQESTALLRLMLQVDPTKRIRIDDLVRHEWLINHVYPEPVKHESVYQVYLNFLNLQ